MLKKIFRAFLFTLVALVAVFVLLCAGFAYRLNNVCGPGQHLIESEADAIEVAKKESAHGQEFDASFIAALSKAENCCTVTRDRNVYLVIAWHVSLNARDGRFAQVMLSNCGDVFDDDTYWDSELYIGGR